MRWCALDKPQWSLIVALDENQEKNTVQEFAE